MNIHDKPLTRSRKVNLAFKRGVKMFLDDERFPVGEGPWVIVRTVPEAIDWMKRFGLPEFISFDNDLGRRQEGRHLADWMVQVDMDLEGRWIPAEFDFYVHSQNSVNGIEKTLRGYLEGREALLERLGIRRPQESRVSDELAKESEQAIAEGPEEKRQKPQSKLQKIPKEKVEAMFQQEREALNRLEKLNPELAASGILAGKVRRLR